MPPVGIRPTTRSIPSLTSSTLPQRWPSIGWRRGALRAWRPVLGAHGAVLGAHGGVGCGAWHGACPEALGWQAPRGTRWLCGWWCGGQEGLGKGPGRGGGQGGSTAAWLRNGAWIPGPLPYPPGQVDHLRASAIMAADGVIPSASGRGCAVPESALRAPENASGGLVRYILRRVVRRAAAFGRQATLYGVGQGAGQHGAG